MALAGVRLGARFARLPHGLDTQLASSGSPLSIVEVMQLKLANALLSRPRVLLLSQLYDMMPIASLKATLAELRAAGTTVLLSSGRPEALDLDAWYWVGARTQQRFTDKDEFARFVAAREAQA